VRLSPHEQGTDHAERATRGTEEDHVRTRWREGPRSITLLRHAESAGNVADAAAHRREAEALDLDLRDADVPLSDTGREQAAAVSRWLADGQGAFPPDAVISSPYRRAADTARIACAGLSLEIDQDERLRERDLGVFDGLTGHGIRARYPAEAERRSRVGKFYYQPPSGESWVDVVLRVRSFLRDLEQLDGAHVWLVTHQAVIMAHRFVLEDLDERGVLALNRENPLPNVSMTVYERSDDRMVLRAWADTSAVEQTDADVTHEPGKLDDEHA
jgi:broad specificity phosphatase PhoE